MLRFREVVTQYRVTQQGFIALLSWSQTRSYCKGQPWNFLRQPCTRKRLVQRTSCSIQYKNGRHCPTLWPPDRPCCASPPRLLSAPGTRARSRPEPPRTSKRGSEIKIIALYFHRMYTGAMSQNVNPPIANAVHIQSDPAANLDIRNRNRGHTSNPFPFSPPLPSVVQFSKNNTH